MYHCRSFQSRRSGAIFPKASQKPLLQPIRKLVYQLLNGLMNYKCFYFLKVSTFISGYLAIHTVIDILPGNISTAFQDLPELELPDFDKNQEKLRSLPNPAASLSSPQSLSDEFTTLNIVPAAEVIDKSQPKCNLTLNSEQYTKLEQLLKQSIGRIAPTVLEKALKNVTNCQDLVQDLVTYFVPEQQQKFRQQATGILEKFPVDLMISKDFPAVDPNLISQCECELAYSIGPIASFITRQVLKSHPQISLLEFVKKLAEQIPEPQQALEFEQRTLAKII